MPCSFCARKVQLRARQEWKHERARDAREETRLLSAFFFVNFRMGALSASRVSLGENRLSSSDDGPRERERERERERGEIHKTLFSRVRVGLSV